jgi:hypothetical protein
VVGRGRRRSSWAPYWALHALCGAGVVVVMGFAARWCFAIVVVVVEVVVGRGREEGGGVQIGPLTCMLRLMPVVCIARPLRQVVVVVVTKVVATFQLS